MTLEKPGNSEILSYSMATQTPLKCMIPAFLCNVVVSIFVLQTVHLFFVSLGCVFAFTICKFILEQLSVIV